MEKNDLQSIVDMISSMSHDEQQALIQSLQSKELPKKKKVRRKHYKKQEQVDDAPQEEVKYERPQSIKRLKKPQNTPLGEHAGKVPASIVPMKKERRPNRFEQSSLINAERRDIEIDKKLNAGRPPTQRERSVEMYEVDCGKCGKSCVVPSSQVFFMPDGEYSFNCNRCSVRG